MSLVGYMPIIIPTIARENKLRDVMSGPKLLSRQKEM